jgi:hypothetical protein
MEETNFLSVVCVALPIGRLCSNFGAQPSISNSLMSLMRSVLTCLAIASLLVSDVIIAVHSASCSHGAASAGAASAVEQTEGNAKHCCLHHHCSRAVAAQTENSQPVAPAHDSDECTICRGALICRFAVVCSAALPPPLENSATPVVVTEVTLVLDHEFFSALSERGPPA